MIIKHKHRTFQEMERIAFAGHLLGRPDATAEQKHDAIQRMAREAWRDIEPR